MSLLSLGIQFGVGLALWGVNRLLYKDKDRKPPRPQAFDIARTEEGTPLPIVYGRCRIDSPVLVWVANQANHTTSAGVLVYGVDLLFVLGVPPYQLIGAVAATNIERALNAVYWGDRKFGQNALDESTVGVVFDHQIFGGPDVGGILSVDVEFREGRPDQGSGGGSRYSLALSSAGVDTTLIPAYRHQMMAFLSSSDVTNGKSIGTDPRLPQIGFEVTARQSSSSMEGMNPADVIYDLITSPIWKLGYPIDRVDFASFQAAKVTLAAENHDYSAVHYQGESAASIIEDILAQIDGVLFEDQATGLIKLRLIRKDYTLGALRELNIDNTHGRPKISIVGHPNTINEVLVSFLDRSREYKPNIARAQNLANIFLSGNRRRTRKIDMPGVCTSELAAKIAARELNAQSYPYRSVVAKVDREFFNLLPGDALRANWPALNIVDVAFRVVDMDLGQLAKGEITLTLVEDVFSNTAGGLEPPVPEVATLDLAPLTDVYFDEAPFFLIQKLMIAGVLPSLEQRVMAFAKSEDEAAQFRLDTFSGGTLGLFEAFAQSDVPTQLFGLTATVQTAYPRELEPYDTTTGLVVHEAMFSNGTASGETLFEELVAAGPVADNDLEQGANLMIAIDSEGRHELLSFQSVTALGSVPKRFRLNNVWRGLLDTVPLDLAVGDRLYLIYESSIGRRAWPNNYYVKGHAIPKSGSRTAPLDNEENQIRIGDGSSTARKDRSLRAADFRVAGYELAGTKGLPAVNAAYPLLGHFKSVSALDGALDSFGRENLIAAGQIVRGDTAFWAVEGGTTFDYHAQKLGESEVAISGKTGLAAIATSGLLLGQAGHGTIDLHCYTVNATKRSWFPARCRIQAPHYRDLLANGSFDYAALAPGWSASVGTVTINAGTNSLSREATGRYITAATGAENLTSIAQTIDVTGYKASGLSALATFYVRNFNGDSDDTAQVRIRALDAADVELDNEISAAVVGPSTHWRRATVELAALPSGTAKLQIEARLNTVADGGDVPDSALTRIQCQIGQYSSQLLTNPSFDGNLTGWTTALGAFSYNNTNPYASDNGTIGSAQGGATNTNELQQEVSVPSGFKYGKAVLTLGQGNVIAGDTGEVIVEVRTGGGTLIATASSGAAAVTNNAWARKRVVVDLPDDAGSIRVRLIANRAAGAGNSGVCFDDLSLRVFKDLDPAVTYEFDFGTPPRSKAPTTWEAFHIAFPELEIPYALWDGNSAAPSRRTAFAVAGVTHAWSDGLAHTAAKLFGYWTVDESNVQTTNAYHFVRAPAGSTIDLRATGGSDEYGKYGKDDAFTIAVLVRSNELGAWQGACGLLGRRDDAGLGWGLQIDAAGFPKVVMQGAGGTQTATASDKVNDGAPRWIVIRNNPATNLCSVHTQSGSASFTADNAGNIDVASAPFRIGRDAAASQSFPGDIGRVILWESALTDADIEQFTKAVGRDPSDLITAWTSSQSVWVPGPTNADGATLVKYAANHVPIGYSATLDASGAGYGVVTAEANTNRISSFDFTENTKWGPEAGIGVTLTQGVVDPTGLARGVNVTNTVGDVGIRLNDIPMVAGTPWKLVFYARSGDVTPKNIRISNLDSDGADKGATEVTPTAQWQRFAVSLSWDNATPTGSLRFRVADSLAGSFELGHVMWFGRADTDYPIAIQDATLAIGNTFGVREGQLDRRFNHDGEIYVECLGQPTVFASPGGALASIDNGSDDDDRRLLVGGDSAAFTLHDLGGAAVSASTVANVASLDWSVIQTLRARWNHGGDPSDVGNLRNQGIHYGSSVVTGSVYVTNAFSSGTTELEKLRIGGRDAGAAAGSSDASHHMFVRRVGFRSREPKLT